MILVKAFIIVFTLLLIIFCPCLLSYHLFWLPLLLFYLSFSFLILTIFSLSILEHSQFEVIILSKVLLFPVLIIIKIFVQLSSLFKLVQAVCPTMIYVFLSLFILAKYLSQKQQHLLPYFAQTSIIYQCLQRQQQPRSTLLNRRKLINNIPRFIQFFRIQCLG